MPGSSSASAREATDNKRADTDGKSHEAAPLPELQRRIDRVVVAVRLRIRALGQQSLKS